MPIEPERIAVLNPKPVQAGEWVLYWMQQSQRPHDNLALEYAISRANQLDLPVLVLFVVMTDYPEANQRHYRFMFEGLAETRQKLARRRIAMVVQKGNPTRRVAGLARRAALLVCDVGYTRHQRSWRQAVAREAPCQTVAVESDVVVPVGLVSTKAEYAARTIRPKISKHLKRFLTPCPRYRPQRSALDLKVKGMNLDDPDTLLTGPGPDRSLSDVSRFFKGGPGRAKKRLRRFIEKHLSHYASHHNQPQTDAISRLSPYLHFGQISPVYMALEIKNAKGIASESRDAYLEQLVVRRELAANFVYYSKNYDRYGCLPGWARKTLAEHAADPRAYQYDEKTLEAAETHDPYWNAAMLEMQVSGFMHTYMRMYWGKKILEWSFSPEEAFATVLALNNRYFLDGRDPNSYAGVGWVFGLHDRAWSEREIFGKVRYMAATGLERKCDIQAYVKKVGRLNEI
jgi:deoxyribodipyrimidine photo-lyase